MGSGIHYCKEFKIEAVRRVIESSRTYSDVANELSIHKDTLRKWVREVKEDRLEDDTGSATDDKKALRDAKREIKRLKDQAAFLNKAAAYQSLLRGGSAAEWYGLIVAEKANDATVSTAMMCEVAGVSESDYYTWRNRLDRPATPSERRRAELSETVCAVFHARKGRCGYRRIHAELRRDDWVVSDRTVRVIMGEHNLGCCHPRPWRYCTKADGTPPASDPDIAAG